MTANLNENGSYYLMARDISETKEIVFSAEGKCPGCHYGRVGIIRMITISDVVISERNIATLSEVVSYRWQCLNCAMSGPAYHR